jgi:hypothetical protein
MCHSPLIHPQLGTQQKPISSYKLVGQFTLSFPSQTSKKYYQEIFKTVLIFLYDHPELRKRALNAEKMICWELERRKQHENKSWIIFWHLKRVFSAQDGCREKLKTIFKIP